jgi:HlyD family secretion protein
MDRVIEKKRWNKKRILTIAGIAALVVLIGMSYYFTSGNSKLNVQKDRITISTISKGIFQENIPVNGAVLPLKTFYLDAVEGGRVEEKYVEDGTVMIKGQPIMKLSNTDLSLSLVNQETEVYNLLTQMQIAKNASQQNTVTKLNQLTDVDNTLKEATRVYNLDKKLYAEKVIGSQEYQQAVNAYDYAVQKKQLTETILQQDSVSTKQGIDQAKQLYQGSQNALAVMKEKVGDLVVRAPIDGQLTSLDAEVGENKNKGDRLGEIDVLSGFKVRVDIDQHYLSRVYIGLKGSFSFADTTYNLVVKKVYSQVTNGSFQVDMEFAGAVPKGIRRGQTLQVLLALSEQRQSVLVPKGGFFQQTGGNWIFKVSADGSKAYRVNIQLGSANTDYYEVTDGLKPGDVVITSSYENFGDKQELELK